MHRTQFDAQLLTESVSSEPTASRNHGRQALALEDGSVFTALAWTGQNPILRLWRNHSLFAQHPLKGQPSAPCLVRNPDGGIAAWLSVDDSICASADLKAPPAPVDGRKGLLQDVAQTPNGRLILAIQKQSELHIACGKETFIVDHDTGHASLDVDEQGRVHLAYEKAHGIEYRVFAEPQIAAATKPIHSERVALAFSYHPVLLAHEGRVFLTYLGESWSQSEEDRKLWDQQGRARRIGLGGYVATLVLEDGRWKRHTVAQAKQFAKPLWPKQPRFGYNYPAVDVRVRMEEFSPPALVLGPDGVPQVLWANTERRWVFASRFLGDEFSAPAEVRGPLEQLTGPCLMPRRVPSALDRLSLAIPTKTRVYLDAIQLPSRTIANGRRIDFIQTDELSICRGLETKLNAMERHPGNPVMRVGTSGGSDNGGISVTVLRRGDGWRAHVLAKQDALQWRSELPATSADGIHWTRRGPVPANTIITIDGQQQPLAHFAVRYTEDPEERDPRHRFKGFWLAPRGAWGRFVPVTSPDETNWSTVQGAQPVMSDEDIYVWRDASDVPERRYKATGNARSLCGRVCAQWTSADGMHWNDIRHTLDWDAPFSSEPFWWEDYPNGGIGRILVDPWAGPDDEEEAHGGFVFRDGDRWLLHYTKWTPDGHVIPALASSRDGLNFTRVCGGDATLPLGEPGTWESGRIAFRSPPYFVDGKWWQFYTGSGWKHGFGGSGKRPHPSVPEAALLSPMQTGLATITEGRWTHLQLQRDADEGLMVTVPLRIESPHRLTMDLEGLSGKSNDSPHPTLSPKGRGDTSDNEASATSFPLPLGERIKVRGSVRCALLEAMTHAPLPGFDFTDCQSISQSGPLVPVRWRGVGLESLGAASLRIAVRIEGHRVKLFGLKLIPA